MTETITSEQQEQYNSTATRLAERMHLARTEMREQDST